MKEERIGIEYYFLSSFVLKREILSKINCIIEEKSELIAACPNQRYDVYFKNSKYLSLKSISDLFELDNTIKNPITYIRQVTTISDKTNNLKNECQLDFDGNEINIRLKITGADRSWVNDLGDSIEEQINRITKNNWVRIIKKNFKNMLFFLVLIITTLFLYSSDNHLKDRYFLNKNDLAKLNEKSQSIENNEDKINFLYEMQSKQISNLFLENNKKQSFQVSNILSIKYLLASLPILIMIICLIYLFFFCYPQSVFLWGDYEEQYEKIVNRRNTIWTVIIISFVVSIMSNLSAYYLFKG